MIHVIETEILEDDYIVHLERPDGSIVTILLPREDRDTYASQVVAESDIPIGLNLVTSGHYT